MTDYYCDLGEDTFSDATGADHAGNEYTGPAGLQAAIRGTGNATALAAGDTLHLKGTGGLSRLVLIDCNGTDVSAWGIGDVVHNKDAGSTWQGVVVQANDAPAGNLGADDLALVWLDSGYDEDDILVAEGVTNDDAGGGAGDPTDVDPLAAKSTPGVYVETDGGSASFIEFVGVNSLWAEDGTLAVLDGGDKAHTGFRNSAICSYIEWRNVHTTQTVDEAWAADASLRYCALVNCVASAGAGGGFGTTYHIQYSSAMHCKAYDNSGGAGFSLSSSSVFNCVAYNNGTYGFRLVYGSVSGCVAYENTTNFYIANGTGLFNCVADAGTYGVSIVGSGTTLTACRITNNISYGVYRSYPTHDPYCFYGDNGANFENDIHDDTVRGDSTRVTTGTVGYVDGDNATLADRNYGLANAATSRRQAVTL